MILITRREKRGVCGGVCLMQTLRVGDRDRLEIFSTPLSLIPGGSKYNTKLEYTIDEGDDGITVTAKASPGRGRRNKEGNRGVEADCRRPWPHRTEFSWPLPPQVFSHASGPFGLSGAIEKVMLEIASTQTQHWLEYSRERCMAAPVKASRPALLCPHCTAAQLGNLPSL